MRYTHLQDSFNIIESPHAQIICKVRARYSISVISSDGFSTIWAQCLVYPRQLADVLTLDTTPWLHRLECLIDVGGRGSLCFSICFSYTATSKWTARFPKPSPLFLRWSDRAKSALPGYNPDCTGVFKEQAS